MGGKVQIRYVLLKHTKKETQDRIRGALARLPKDWGGRPEYVVPVLKPLPLAPELEDKPVPTEMDVVRFRKQRCCAPDGHMYECIVVDNVIVAVHEDYMKRQRDRQSKSHRDRFRSGYTPQVKA